MLFVFNRWKEPFFSNKVKYIRSSTPDNPDSRNMGIFLLVLHH
jgi:hypothetical protein